MGGTGKDSTLVNLVRVLLLVVGMFLAIDSATLAGRAVVESNQVVSVVTNICTGDGITVSGTVRTVTRTEAGFIEGQITFSGMTGVGADGTSYVLPYSQGSTIHIQPGLVQTIEVNYRLIGRGQAPDSHLHEIYHATFSATGALVSLTHEIHVTCG